MEAYQVQTVYQNIKKSELSVRVPGSKSITNRALLLATQATGRSTLENVLFSDDSRHFINCVSDMGFEIEVDEKAQRVSVLGLGGNIPDQNAKLYVGSAGTAARFLTALLGVCEGEYFLDSSDQMKKRPMAPLIRALREMGAEVSCKEAEGYFPLQIKGNAQPKDHVNVNIDDSSQFLSALLIALGAKKQKSRIHVEGSHGMSYIEMTTSMMKQFGVSAKREDNDFIISGEDSYRALDYIIEPDVSAACYFYAMAAILGIGVTVKYVHSDSLQGDLEFLRLLAQMGCTIEERKEGLHLMGPKDGRLKGINADMHACSDQAITMAAIAPFADSPVTIRGIGHIRLQESDRIAGMLEALRAMQIECEELEDGIRIYPGEPKAAKIKTYDDHRMAMGFSVTGLRAEGITILDPLCCRKTFENYFEVLDACISELMELN